MRSIALALSVLCILSCSAPNAPEPRTGLDAFYLLHVPALECDDGAAVTQPPHLVRLTQEGGHSVITRMYPDLYFRAVKSKRDIIRDRLDAGLVMKAAGDAGEITVQGVDLDEHGVGYRLISLTGRQEEPSWWRGHAEVVPAPYLELAPAAFTSEWSMQPAPASSVYQRMIHAFRFLSDYGAGREVYSTHPSPEPPALRTEEDYITFLRSEDPGWPKRDATTVSINEHFRVLMADALEKGQILLKDGQFAVSEEVAKTYDGEEPLREIGIDVTYEGEQRKAKPPYDPRLRANRPRLVGRTIRFLATKPRDEAEGFLVTGGSTQDLDYLRRLGYTWEELRYIPDVAFLAGHMTTVPDDLKARIAKGYIRDGSLDYFPEMSFEKLAAVPNPVLLMACLPHMGREQAEKLV